MKSQDEEDAAVQPQGVKRRRITRREGILAAANPMKSQDKEEKEEKEEAVVEPLGVKPLHITKRALRNKALSVSFDEKDLTEYVTGFHKRKKKRRKIAEQQTQEALRRKRIEIRKKRKAERDFAIFGATAPDTEAVPKEGDEEELKDDEEKEPITSISGTTLYQNGDVKVTVTTSEITHEEEEVVPSKRIINTGEEGGKKKQTIPVVAKKKPMKKAGKKKSQSKTQTKRDKRKGNQKDKKKR